MSLQLCGTSDHPEGQAEEGLVGIFRSTVTEEIMRVLKQLLFVMARKGVAGSSSSSAVRHLHCARCRRAGGFSVADCEQPERRPSSEVTCKAAGAGEEQEGESESLDERYTAEQRSAILRVLNSATERELCAVKRLRGQKSQKIVEYRSRNGPFRDLESVVNVPGLKHKTAAVAFHSILSPSESKKNLDSLKEDKKKGRNRLVKAIRPEVDLNILKEARVIVSIAYSTSRIAWAHVDRARAVRDWQQEDCHSFMRGAYTASAYLRDVSAVVSRMPTADFFVVEKPGISLQNTSLYPAMAHLRTVEAMLFALLESPHGPPGSKPKVLNMMRTAVGRHFGLMVGESRTSGVRAVQDMMTDSVIQKAPRVTFPPELLARYRNAFQMSSRNRGEELCDALLQAVAFYELLKE
uniref:Transcription elongation factor, mitochondrial n=2 Tax=Scleropages formosus TaxID=113540 RepID=A0A8C9STT3_SCLFO